MGTPTKYEKPVEPSKINPNDPLAPTPVEVPDATHITEEPGVHEASGTGTTEGDVSNEEAEAIDYSI